MGGGMVGSIMYNTYYSLKSTLISAIYLFVTIICKYSTANLIKMLLNSDIHFKATDYLFQFRISESEEKAMEWDKVLKKSAISRPGDHRSHAFN